MEQNQEMLPQNPIVVPTPQSSNGYRLWIVAIIALLTLTVGGVGGYILGTKQTRPSNPTPQTTQILPSPTTIVNITEPSPTTTVTTPTTNINWVTKSVPIQYESAFLGSKTDNMEVKVPSDWTFQTTPQATNPDSLIKNCSTYTITSKDQSMKLNLQPICTGWTAKYTSWPTDAVIVLQQKLGGNDGLHNEYRVRLLTSSNNYNYVDAVMEPDRLLDKSKDQVMDVLTVGYAPPNESTNDFFFIAVYLTASYSGQSNTKDSYLSIADQIAASITLR